MWQSASLIRKCVVELTGKNSVNPSTIPSSTDNQESLKLFLLDALPFSPHPAGFSAFRTRRCAANNTASTSLRYDSHAASRTQRPLHRRLPFPPKSFAPPPAPASSRSLPATPSPVPFSGAPPLHPA